MLTKRFPVPWGWVFIIVLLVWFWHKPLLKMYFILDYKSQIIKYSRLYQLDPAMIGAIVYVESRFDPTAKSHKGAIGLMQIMPDTGGWIARKLAWKDFRPEDLQEPEKNLQAGIWYLAYLRDYFHHDYLALASYNAGTRYVDDWVKNGVWDGDRTRVEQVPFPETRQYLLQIITLRKIYRYLYPELNNSSITASPF